MTLRHWVYLANALETAEVLSGVRGAHEDIPPAGTELHNAFVGQVSTLMPPLSGLRLPFYVTGVSDYPDPSDWSHMTLGAFINQVGLDHAAWVGRLASLFDATVGRAISTIDQWPVIVKGTREDSVMRWIHTITKGTLGGVEEFQYGLNFGKPGADPDWDEAALTAFATDAASKLADSLNADSSDLGGVPAMNAFSADVVFTEVGVCQQEITDAVDVHGDGGNLSQSTETKWAMINGTAGITGLSGAHSLPFEVSCAVTTRTEHRGPSGRGRFYLPPQNVGAMSTGGKFLPNQVLGSAKIVTGWMSAIAGAYDVVPVVVSQRRLILNEITQLTVGLVPDSQRRRRWSQLEAPVVVWEVA